MSLAPVAVAPVTTVCPLSQCMLVPLGCLLRDPSNGQGHGPPASRSTVGCKPGHNSPSDTITETSKKVCGRIGRDQPARMGRGQSLKRPDRPDEVRGQRAREDTEGAGLPSCFTEGCIREVETHQVVTP